MRSENAISLLEAAYDTSVPATQWLRHIADAEARIAQPNIGAL